jgi:subtilisin family serine protease
MQILFFMVGGMLFISCCSLLAQESDGNASRQVFDKLESPVKLSGSSLSAHNSTYDPKSIDDDWFATKIRAAEVPVEEVDFGGRSSILIAVLDSGIDTAHPSFSHNLWQHRGGYADYNHTLPTDKVGWDFVNNRASTDDALPSSHGTHVAGLASARWLGTNKKYLAFDSGKIDAHIELLILKVADTTERVSNVEGAIDFALRSGARIVSGSWTLAPGTGAGLPIRTYQSLLFVLAAGNGEDGKDGVEITKDHPIYPASFGPLSNLIIVGATDPDDNVAYFSNWGKEYVQIFAPGVEIKSTVRTTMTKGLPYGRLSGTSQATPLVALTAALIWANHPKLAVEDVKNRLLVTSDFAGDTWKKGSGGRLNMAKAIIVDHDLLELKDGTLHVGQILNKTFDFTDALTCDPQGHPAPKITRYFVQTNGIVRLAVSAFDGKSVLFANSSTPFLGTLCDKEITFVNSDGNTLHKSPSDVTDLVWAMYRE